MRRISQRSLHRVVLKITRPRIDSSSRPSSLPQESAISAKSVGGHDFETVWVPSARLVESFDPSLHVPVVDF